ncbi:hypothetical protein SB769_36115, partial [Burkholderia sp. SIMBA_024]
MAEENLRPFRPDQTIHMTDNREEMQRARHAFELAASGRHVVMVSSGDPGVLAMAAAESRLVRAAGRAALAGDAAGGVLDARWQREAFVRR